MNSLVRHLASAVCALVLAGSAAGANVTWQAVTLGSSSSYRFALYASRPLGEPLDGITQVVVIQHGLGRNGNGYYAAGRQLMDDLHVDPARTLLIAPQFFVTRDAGKPGMAEIPRWTGGGWLAGLAAVGGGSSVSSLAVYDDLLMWLADRKRLPQLERIVLAGHSAGAQLLQRYAALNRVDEKLRAAGTAVRYVIANPSSYLYFTDERPGAHGRFAPADHAACPDVNEYKYGFARMIPYGAGLDPDQAFARYAGRDVVYLLGDRDVNPLHPLLDKTCAGEAQGRYRLERGLNYLREEARIAKTMTGGGTLAHHAYLVHGVAHNQRRMFNSACGSQMLFGSPAPQGAACGAVDIMGGARPGGQS